MPASGAFSYSYSAVGDIKSTHQYDVTVTFKITFGTESYGYNYSGAYYEIWCNGQMQSGTATFDIGYGQWGTIGSKTFRITMDSSGKSKDINFGGYISTGVSPSEINTGTVFGCTLPAVTWLWTVSYNANGGSGAPSSQTKTYGSTLKLSSTKPTKTGYTFQGWATSKSGSVAYAAGANYTNNSAVTLYAVWKANTWTVSYNANGGSGAPSNQTKTYGQNLTLSSTRPTRNLYNFKGWGTSAGSTTVAYAPGATYTSNSAITLYAIWELAWVAPRITNVALERCTSDGTASEFGTYYKISFAWAADAASPRIVIMRKESGTTTWTSDYHGDGEGTSGTHSGVYGAGGLSTEYSYDIRISVNDEIETSAYDTQIAPIAYAIDFKAGGKGVSFLTPARQDGIVFGASPAVYKANADADVGGAIDTCFYAERTDTGKSVWMGVGSGGVNRGLYDSTAGDWIIYRDGDNHNSISGVTFTNKPLVRSSSGTWIAGRDNTVVRQNYVTSTEGMGWNPVASVKTTNGEWSIGNCGGNYLKFVYTTDTDYKAGTNKALVIDLNHNTNAPDRKLYAGAVIYYNSSGSNGTITLSNSANNFNMLEIYFRTNEGTNWVQSCKVYNPNGKYVLLSAILSDSESSGGYIWVKGRTVYINGTSISTSSSHAAEGWFNGNNACGYNSSKNFIYITQVVGYI